MSNLSLVFICLLLGLAFQRIKRFPQDAAVSLNAYVIYVALPALVLDAIPKLVLDRRALMLVVAAWLVMIFSALLVFSLSKWRRWSRSVTGALMLVVTLGNTGFVGIPLIEAHLGSGAIPYAVLYDQFGTFLALNTFGIAVAGYYSEQEGPKTSLWKNILSFPAFIALLLAFVMRFVGYPHWLAEVLPRIASTLVPVVMVAVGLQWRLRLERKHVGPVLLAIALILFIEPAFAWALVTLVGANGLAAHVVVLEAAMPAMISASVLAVAHQLEPRLASAIVGYSLMLSLLTVWLWRLLIGA